MIHSAVEALETWLDGPLPSYYRKFLLTHPTGIHGDLVVLYELESVIERNDTYETKKYCPGYITIGDDSGGCAIVVSLQDETGSVYLVGHGSMTPDQFEPITSSFESWLEQGCPLPE